MQSSRSRDLVTLQIDNDIVEISKVARVVDAFTAKHGLPQAVASAVNISLDEILNNTISYGYRDTAQHQITISLFLQDDFLVTEVTDDARPFDPLRTRKQPKSNNLRERSIGGVGLTFVRALMDHAHYERAGKFNHLRLLKRINCPNGE